MVGLSVISIPEIRKGKKEGGKEEMKKGKEGHREEIQKKEGERKKGKRDTKAGKTTKH